MDRPRDYTDLAIEAWARAFPDLDLVAFGIALRLIRAGRLMEASLDRITGRHGFDVRGDYEVLATLRRAHPTPLRPQDLADRVMISAPGITGRLDRLEDAGFVTRVPHPTDRRATFIEITSAGIEAADRTFRSVADDTAALFEALSPAQRALTDELREVLLVLGDRPRS